MALTRVTIGDRQNLVNVLELPMIELEEFSQLYYLLEELEDREDRLGVDLLTPLRETVAAIQSIDADISALKTANGGQGNANEITVDIKDELSWTVKSGGSTGFVNGEQVLMGSPLASLLSEKARLVKDIHRQLNAYRRQDGYPFGYYQQPPQSMIIG